ncbi:MAG: hypothetical protein ABSE73_18535 [Planctomycetota bacterium]
MQAKTKNHAVKAPAKKRPRLSRKKRELLKLLRRWTEEGDKEEQRETGEYLMKALAETRAGYQKLFSGVSCCDSTLEDIKWG